jgi:carboxymethylenebutenolidase
MDVPGAVGDTPVESDALTIESSTGDVNAFIARPASGTTARGGVIVIHEAFGLNDHIRDVARRFAAAGYDTIAPDLYSRSGPPAADDMADLFAKMLALADSDVVADLDAAAAALRKLDTSNGRVGVIGFCSGGRQTLLFACESDAPTAAVPCWGGFIDRASPTDEATPQRPTPVIDLVGQVSCPLLVVGGAEDQNPSPAVLAELERRLEQQGKEATVKIFDAAGHAFFADYRPSYNAEAAHELWADVAEFFGRHLDGEVV